MANSSSLFLQQSYLDNWDNYLAVLQGGPSAVTWDDIILTASNEKQAEAYRVQIDERLARGHLPSGTRFAVLSDPEGKRVGSGGATLNALRYLHQVCPSFAERRILVIHSGGDSKRVPQYSAIGKLFSPVPRALPDGRRSTLFDEFIIGLTGLASRFEEGMLVCSGDVLLLFNPLQVEFFGKGAAALSIKEDVDTGSNHGVYLRDDAGNVGNFLHKLPSAALSALGTVDARGKVDIDTGAVLLGVDILRDLQGLINQEEAFHAFVNERARLSFYADFLFPLASGATLEEFYKEKPEGDFTPELKACRETLWGILHKYRMQLIRLSPASFIHFGTTQELLNLVTREIDQYNYLNWSRNVITNSGADTFAASNSYISRNARVGQNAYIEDSYIHHDTVLGPGCVLSGVTLSGEEVPGGAVLHGLKLDDGRFVVRMYGVRDNPKESRLFDIQLEEPLWTAKLYPVCATISEAVSATLAAYEHQFTCKPGLEYMSLLDSYLRADLSAIPPWQEKLGDRVRVEMLLEAIESRQFLDDAVAVFQNGLSENAVSLLTQEAGRQDTGSIEGFGRRIRVYRALSKLTQGEERKRFSDLCFGEIRDVIFMSAVEGLVFDPACAIAEEEYVVRLPVRVNWGGGWSDTPPYCMEHGGSVLNTAINLGGQLPIEAVLKRTGTHTVVLSSLDNGAYREFTDIASLQDIGNPADPFALHKAALIACGIIPYREQLPLQEILRRLGGGFSLSTQVINIPRGSGLGTSSILAGACVKGIFGFTGREIHDVELYNRVLCMEQLMSTGGGWQDQVGGLAPGVKLVTSSPSLRQEICVTPLRLSAETLDELNRRFCLIYTGQRRLARNLLREVVGRYIDNQPDAVMVLYEIQRIAALMRFELEKGNVDEFARLLSRHWELSQRLDRGCTNTCIDQIFLTIQDLIDGKMICGAGGGGFLQVVLKKGVTMNALRTRLNEVFQDSGVDVWACAIAHEA